jgi:predicted O-methyltransferase YrrM
VKALRRLRFGLATVTGLARRGFFIPYRYADTVQERGYPALEPFFAAAEPAMDEVLQAIAAHAGALARIGKEPGGPRWNQEWFPPLDAAAAYAVVRGTAPRRIVEIGSGHSTRFMARAVADGGLATQILCVDPAPRASLASLGVTHRPRVFGDADIPDIAALQAGDILFIDSSHVAMPGTDVDRLFLDVMPRLAAGVLVHVHDVLLPDAYPPAWSWRGYNEQTVVGALLAGEGWGIVFASRYAATRLAGKVASALPADLPRGMDAPETSLWIRKR